MTIRDVLVVGGGAAGATAAFHLAKSGKNVCLLEKSNTINPKTCAGGISASIQKWFPFSIDSAVEKTISKVKFSWRLEDHVVAELPNTNSFWIVKRENLDSLIITKAIEEGTEFIQSFCVSEIKRINDYWVVFSQTGERIKSKIIIIADGSNSPWPYKFNLGPKRHHNAFTTSIRLQGNGSIEEDIARFEFGLVPKGFAWAFPVKGAVNVGIGTFIGKDINDPNLILNQLLPDIGFDPRDRHPERSLLRVWNGHSRLDGDSLLVVGDAASLCDPFLAEGLRPAIMSGYEAAISINKFLEGHEKDLACYTNSIRKKWGNSMVWGKRIAQVFYRFPKTGYQLGIKRPTVPKRIAQILSGEMGYEDIAHRAIKRLLLKA